MDVALFIPIRKVVERGRGERTLGFVFGVKYLIIENWPTNNFERLGECKEIESRYH